MATRMLIDARHPEETRVAVLKGNRIEEFDFESAEHKQIKGNIYLAKVTRVEPSLQAAFVDFGGNRHGFLAFSEIHPDYYQIPQSDREALLAEEQAHAEEEAALRAAEDEFGDDYEDDEDDSELDGVEEIDTSEKDDVATIEDGHVDEEGDDQRNDDGSDGDEAEGDESAQGDAEQDGEANDEAGEEPRSRRGRGRRQGGGRGRAKEAQADELRAKRQALRRRYKIQDVIQRRQVLLVQVVKEERGNKGAALTTYLSLAGRYCVLMPNSSHGGGISRKISSGADRKRLKQIVGEMSLPKSMGLIVRTAGLQRTKTEIKRDFDYLARLWDEIREKTLASSAPAMIHTDSDLIKRAIRDIYNREIEEVVVEGDEGYRSARSFMKLLMPSHVKRVKQYADAVPLFQRYGAEDQLSAMYDPVVQLKSGGYLVINPTEALVSIDINSGRSTKEHGIEATALNTNLEAAREIARQLRLRDMAGLVVIDFIDMEYGSNVRKVEKCMKDALKNDRARIQVGRISGFGLMEMSRQRLRTGVLEATTRGCPHCDGTGLVRTASSAGLSALRLIEDEAAKGKGTTISLYASTEAAVYMLNAKRADLAEIEVRYGVTVEVLPEGEQEGAKMRVASSGPRPTSVPKFEPIADEVEDDFIEEDEDDEAEDEAEAQEERSERPARSGQGEDEGRGKRRRRRRGGRGRDREDEGASADPQESPEERARRIGLEDLADEDEDAEDGTQRPQAAGDHPEDTGEDRPKKRRRRGGRRRRRQGEPGEFGAEGEADEGDEAGEQADETAGFEGNEAGEAIAGAFAPEVSPVDAEPETSEAAEPVAEAPADQPAPAPKRPRRRKAATAEAADADATASAPAVPEVAAEADAEAASKPRSRRKAAVKEPADATGAEGEAPAKPRRSRKKAAEAAETPAVAAEADAQSEISPELALSDASGTAEAAAPPAPAAPAQAASTTLAITDAADSDGSPRRGWWQRTFGA